MLMQRCGQALFWKLAGRARCGSFGALAEAFSGEEMRKMWHYRRGVLRTTFPVFCHSRTLKERRSDCQPYNGFS
jgi:hypothetical protein